jgi:methyl-accepting chemotaxis protein
MHSGKPLWRGAGLLALAIPCLTSCAEQTKIKECNALVGVINAGVEKIQKGTTLSPDAGTAVTELRTLADEMDAIAKAAEAVELSIPELKKFSQDYKDMAIEVAASARELAQAVDNVDMEKMTKAQTRMDRAVKREDPLVEEINKFCHAP